MDVAFLLPLAAGALAIGAAYALAALGFVLVINATSAVNFAHGDLVVAGGYAAVALASVLPLPGIALLPAVVLLMAALGLLLSWLAYFPLMDRPVTAVFVSTIALGVVLQNSLNAAFGPAPLAGPPLVVSGQLGGGLDAQSLAVVLVAAVLLASVHGLLQGTQLGRRLRAVAQDREMARALGIEPVRMIALTFALSAALAGTAGLMLANQFFVEPTAGANLMIKAYIAVVIGGWGRVWGAAAGAFLIALFEVGVAAWLSYAVAEGLLYLALLAILLLRPTGLFGEAAGRRA